MDLTMTLSAATLDAYASAAGLPSRSAALAVAVARLRADVLEDAYAVAFEEWTTDPDAGLWDLTSADGPAHPAPR